jgi:5'-nucleotidase
MSFQSGYRSSRNMPLPRHSQGKWSLALALIWLASGATATPSHELQNRLQAAKAVQWRIPFSAKRAVVHLLAINDFHGQLGPGKQTAGRPVGSAPVLQSYLQAAGASDTHTLIAEVGDLVGGSPPISALLQDEPTVMWFNGLGNNHCAKPLDPRCNLVGTIGNHEFDEGLGELQRLLDGGNHPKGPFLENPWTGAHFPVVSANIHKDGQLLWPAAVVKQVQGVQVAFVGAVLHDLASVVSPSAIAGLTIEDEAAAINRVVPELQRRGIHAIVALVHQGGRQDAYDGVTNDAAPPPDGVITAIAQKLDPDVDVVLSAHTHAFSNALVARPNGGPPILVTQAFSSGTAYADVSLEIEPSSDEVVAKSARIVTTFADEGPGLAPDQQTQKLVDAAQARVAPLVNQVAGTAPQPITAQANEAGESPLGDLIAEAQRQAMGSDFAFTNPGGIRGDLGAGPVTYGEVFAIQPFGNVLVQLTMTGSQIKALLEAQWQGDYPRILAPAGLRYTWQASSPTGSRVIALSREDGTPLTDQAIYTVTVNSYLADGGDQFALLADPALARSTGPADVDALWAYLEAQGGIITAPVPGLIQRFP